MRVILRNFVTCPTLFRVTPGSRLLPVAKERGEEGRKGQRPKGNRPHIELAADHEIRDAKRDSVRQYRRGPAPVLAGFKGERTSEEPDRPEGQGDEISS